MAKKNIIDKLDEFVQSYRNQLELHEGSSLTALTSNAKTALSGLKKHLSNNEKAKAGMDQVKECLEKIERVTKQQDKQFSSKILKKMEDTIDDLRNKFDCESATDCNPTSENPAEKTASDAPTRKSAQPKAATKKTPLTKTAAKKQVTPKTGTTAVAKKTAGSKPSSSEKRGPSKTATPNTGKKTSGTKKEA